MAASTTSHPAYAGLSASESAALTKLYEQCQQDNVSWPISSVTDNASDKGIIDLFTLLRYLHARKFDPDAAFKQYSASASWRRKYNLEDTYDNIDIDKFETIRRLQPQWTGRYDSTGVPIMVYVVSQVRAEDILALHTADPKLASVFLAAEYVTQFVQPFCGHVQGGPDTTHIDTSINIIDLSHVGVPTFWRLRKLLGVASEMATAHYPETVKRIYVVGAPYFFPTIWKFVTAWFEPNTTKKIVVLSAGEAQATLFHDLGKENVPSGFGGDLDWEFGDFPRLDAEAKGLTRTLGDEWTPGPLRFLDSGPGDGKRILAVGTEGGTARRLEV